MDGMDGMDGIQGQSRDERPTATEHTTKRQTPDLTDPNHNPFES